MAAISRDRYLAQVEELGKRYSKFAYLGCRVDDDNLVVLMFSNERSAVEKSLLRFADGSDGAYQLVVLREEQPRPAAKPKKVAAKSAKPKPAARRPAKNRMKTFAEYRQEVLEEERRR